MIDEAGGSSDRRASTTWSCATTSCGQAPTTAAARERSRCVSDPGYFGPAPLQPTSASIFVPGVVFAVSQIDLQRMIFVGLVASS